MKDYRNNYIECFDDERKNGNGVIVTLRFGYSYYANEHSGVQGFDTITEAVRSSRRKNIFECRCKECQQGIV